jgi:hypothetical protein
MAPSASVYICGRCTHDRRVGGSVFGRCQHSIDDMDEAVGGFDVGLDDGHL